ncbi:HNH endonuclease [Cronobacter phage LPCS28]|uniref:HNH nuclease domain-containing protein n=1 Tax=Cronobacter phage LPCS28 TaxID=2924885 RepID=A0AAE9G9E8_9CAUD|nr:HNH endonuclease [Cronobacter phage LPCS28]UNY46959.1 hypothetical protein EHEKIMEA_00075 [Cronobacter phage LPCS28]
MAKSPQPKKLVVCENILCNKEFLRNPSAIIEGQKIYCNHECRVTHERHINVTEWLSGRLVGYKGKCKQLKPFVRDYVIKKNGGTQCSQCGWNEKHPIDNRSLTEIDHIDGNADNCSPENLRVLCPNCHSMTPTYRARNKVSTRNR